MLIVGSASIGTIAIVVVLVIIAISVFVLRWNHDDNRWKK